MFSSVINRVRSIVAAHTALDQCPKKNPGMTLNISGQLLIRAYATGLRSVTRRSTTGCCYFLPQLSSHTQHTSYPNNRQRDMHAAYRHLVVGLQVVPHLVHRKRLGVHHRLHRKLYSFIKRCWGSTEAIPQHSSCVTTIPSIFIRDRVHAVSGGDMV